MAWISVNYILLCGQFLLLLTVLFLQCLEGIHSHNSTAAAAVDAANATPGATATASAASASAAASAAPSSALPPDNATTPVLATDRGHNYTEQYEYRPPSPVVLCSFL